MSLPSAANVEPTAYDPARLEPMLEALAVGAAERERDRVAPRAEIRQLARAGLGTLRVPATYGGPGLSLRELFAIVVRLAAADANVAQSLRAHYFFVEGRLASPDSKQRARWLPEVLRGALFGNATVERHTTDIFGVQATLRPAGDHHVLSATKYYSTGSLYADFVAVTARRPDDTMVTAVVPSDRPGVQLDDDWDGMGQRLTASGTSRFEDVVVHDDEILPSAVGSRGPVPRAAFLQLFLVAVMAGIAGNVADDAAAVVRDRRRTFDHASGATPANDPLILQVAGQIATNAYACESVVLTAAEAMDVAATARDDIDAVHRAAERVAMAQVLVSDLAPRTAEMLFSVGGASATSRDANLDRHWRNARTVASHNPAMYKARALGDLLVNGERLPSNGWF